MTDIGLTHFATRAAALRVERAAMARLVAEAKERQINLGYNLLCIARNMETLLDCGVAKDAIAEALAGLKDAIINADEACSKTIDEAGEYSETLDMTEADALLAKVRA